MPRHDHQCGQPADLSRSSDTVRAARPNGASARTAPALRFPRCRRPRISRAMAGICARRDCGGDRGRPPAYPGRRHRALPAGDRRGIGAGSGHSRGDQARGDRASSSVGRCWVSRAAGPARSGGCATAVPRRQTAPRPRLRGGASDRSDHWGLAATDAIGTRLPVRDNPVGAAARAALRSVQRPAHADDRGRRCGRGGGARRPPSRSQPPGYEGGGSSRTPVTPAGRYAARCRASRSAARHPAIRQTPNDLVPSSNDSGPRTRCAIFGKFVALLAPFY